MRKTKKLLGILLACMMLISMLSVGVFAATGDQNNPINANDKWFGWGVDCFLLNTTLEAGDTDGLWYELTADKAGILQVEHSTPSDTPIDYQITVKVNGQEYLGYEDGVYNMPVITLPVAIGDVISIHIVAQDTSLGGTVYMNAKFISGANDNLQTVKLKGANMKVWVANGATVYFQDDSLQAEYAAMGLNLKSSVNGEGITVISNTESYTDTDGDGIVELKLSGSAGSAGAPLVKPYFAIENQSGTDAWFVLNVTDSAHECVYDDDADVDCNTCGDIREIVSPSCQHEYAYPCDGWCMNCYEFTNPDATHKMIHVGAVPATCQAPGNIEYYTCEYCGGCWDNENAMGMPLNQMMIKTFADHEYMYPCDGWCINCYEFTNPEASHSLRHVKAKDATCTENGNIEYWTCEHCGGCWDNENAMGMPLNQMMVTVWAQHTYDDDMDTDCNSCGETRVVDYVVQSFSGASMSEVTNDGLSGLAFKFTLNNMEGLAVVTGTKYVADYKNTYVTPNSTGTYKLVKMGAVVSNNWGVTYLDCVDNINTLDVPAKKIILEGEDAPYFAVRIINIPEEENNTYITARPYYVYQNEAGEPITVYGDEQMACVAEQMN